MNTDSPLFHVGRPTGYHQEYTEVGVWQAYLSFELRRVCHKARFTIDTVDTARILLARNQLVRRARLNRADYLLMIDPDMIPDCRLGYWPEAESFMESSWRKLQECPRCVLAAPCRGAGPTHDGPQRWRVHVFQKGEGEETLIRMETQDAAMLRGWQEVEAIGSGMMLIPMAVFNRLDEDAEQRGLGVVPYFDDVYEDQAKTEIRYTQDIYFCLRCRKAGIPIYANFSAWAGHWQRARDDGAWPLPTMEMYQQVLVAQSQ